MKGREQTRSASEAIDHSLALETRFRLWRLGKHSGMTDADHAASNVSTSLCAGLGTSVDEDEDALCRSQLGKRTVKDDIASRICEIQLR